MFHHWNTKGSLVRTLCMVLCGVAGGAAVRADGTPSVGTKVGQMHPDFLLPTLDGGWDRLSDHRGRKVLLVHFASW